MRITISRRKAVQRDSGYPCSTLYDKIKRGSFPPPVPIGPAAVGWIDSEVQKVNAARAAGWTEDQIKQLVADLIAARSSYMEAAA